ncbi:MAG TPA: hypothetical protein VML75_24945 [Kofleriaceae bacterium]|nr:hypothetical protein [Kofleriaceae bacterium]
MPVWQRRFLIACAAVIGYCVGYVVCDFGELQKLTYDPIARGWLMTSQPTPMSMAYPGMVLWGLSGALVAGGLAYGATRLVNRELPGRVERLMGAWALTAFVFAGGYYTWGLWPF